MLENPIITNEILVIILLILVNAIMTLSEMAIVSAKKTRLQNRAERGEQGAMVALELANQPTRFLSTIQVAITLIGILMGAYGGATIAEAIAEYLQTFPGLAPYGEAIGVVLVVITVTLLSIVFGELVPKRIALGNPEVIAARISRPMLAFSRLLNPVVRFLSGFTELILRLFKVKHSQEPSITEEEIRLIIREARDIGIFEKVEHEIFNRVMRLNNRKVSTIMTHRIDVDWLDLDDTHDELLSRILESTHSRLPAARGDLDETLGILHLKDLFASQILEESMDIDALLKPALYVPESMTAIELMEFYRTTRSHLALVVDEYGGVIGLVTATDVLESIVGDLPVEGEVEEQELVQREDGSWLVDGAISIEDLKVKLDLFELPEEDELKFETLAGLIYEQLGKIPSPGEFFELNQFRFEVMDMDGNRIDKVLISPK